MPGLPITGTTLKSYDTCIANLATALGTANDAMAVANALLAYEQTIRTTQAPSGADAVSVVDALARAIIAREGGTTRTQYRFNEVVSILVARGIADPR